MNAPEYTRTCEVCNAQYRPPLKEDGTPSLTKHQVCSKGCYDSKRWAASIGGDANRVRSRKTHKSIVS